MLAQMLIPLLLILGSAGRYIAVQGDLGINDHCPLFIGGLSSDIYRDRIEKAGGTVCNSTRHLAEKL